MLTIKDQKYIKHNMFIDDDGVDIYYFHIPILKVDSTTLPGSNCYKIISVNNPAECTIEIYKRTNSLVELKMKNNSTLCFTLYISLDNNLYGANITMESSHILSLYFDSLYWVMEWDRHISDYLITINAFGYITKIQRVSDKVKASFNTDGNISEVTL